MWGSLNPFLISYLKLYESSIKNVDGFFCMGIVIFCTNVNASTGVYLEKRIGYKKLYVLANIFIITGYLFIYLSKSLIIVLFILAFIGFSTGLIVNISVYSVCKYNKS